MSTAAYRFRWLFRSYLDGVRPAGLQLGALVNPLDRPRCLTFDGLFRQSRGFGGHVQTVGAVIVAIGKVKWFNNAKGYGFVVADEFGEDLFAHYSAIEMDGYKTLKAGQDVQFDVTEGPKGLHATNIRAVNAGVEVDLPEEEDDDDNIGNRIDDDDDRRPGYA